MNIEELVDALRVEAGYVQHFTWEGGGRVFARAADVIEKQQNELRVLRQALHEANQRSYELDHMIEIMARYKPYTDVEMFRMRKEARGGSE